MSPSVGRRAGAVAVCIAIATTASHAVAAHAEDSHADAYRSQLEVALASVPRQGEIHGVLTPLQIEALELQDRLIFEADRKIRPELEKAGVFDSGIVTASLTPPVRYFVSDLEPVKELFDHDQYGTLFTIERPRYTEQELIADLTQISLKWRQQLPDEPYSALGVDVEQGRLELEVEADRLAIAREFISRNAAGAAPIDIKVGPMPEEQGPCTSRDNCTGEWEAGQIMRQNPSNARCGLGLQVRRGSDEQFLTAGHCADSPATSMYHSGYPYDTTLTIVANLYGVGSPFSVDAARVQMPNHKESDEVYGFAYDVNWFRNAYANELACISRAAGNSISCEYVSHTYTTWFSGGCSCYVAGSRADSYSSTSGDSGSIVMKFGTTAIGIHNASGGRFARSGDWLTTWGLSFVD